MATSNSITEKSVKAAIANAVKSAKSANIAIHKAAMDCARFAEQHGDIRLAVELVVELRKHARQHVDPLVRWYLQFFPCKIAFDKETNTYAGSLKKGRKDDDWRFNDADATPFHELDVVQQEKEIDLATIFKMLRAVSSKSEKTVKDGKFNYTDATVVSMVGRRVAELEAQLCRDNGLAFDGKRIVRVA